MNPLVVAISAIVSLLENIKTYPGTQYATIDLTAAFVWYMFKRATRNNLLLVERPIGYLYSFTTRIY